MHLYHLLSVSLLSTALVISCDRGGSDSSPCPDDQVLLNDVCQPAEAVTEEALRLTKVRMTYLNVLYDLSQPFYLNNTIPIEFGLTAQSNDNANPGRKDIPVLFSFIEAEPEDPDNVKGCASNAIVVDVVGDGQEKVVKANIWPTTQCGFVGPEGKKMHMRVSFDSGGTDSQELDFPELTLTPELASQEDNALCRKTLDPNAEDPGIGCSYELELRALPVVDGKTAVDIRYTSFTSESSVAVFTPNSTSLRKSGFSLTQEEPIDETETTDPNANPEETGQELDQLAGDSESEVVDSVAAINDGSQSENLQAAVVVQSVFILNGRDPYVTNIDRSLVRPEDEQEIPGIKEDLTFDKSEEELASLDALPSSAEIRFSMAPTDDQSSFLALTVSNPADESGERLAAAPLNNLNPGTKNTFSHELHIEGDLLAAVSAGGPWAGKKDFTIQSCFEASFEQDGNQGEFNINDCQTIQVVLIQREANTLGASEAELGRDLARNLGNSNRVALRSEFRNNNTLNLETISSENTASAKVVGNIGRRFAVTISKAFANQSYTFSEDIVKTHVGVDAFGKRIFNYVEESSPNDETPDESGRAKKSKKEDQKFRAAKALKLPTLRVPVGPVVLFLKARVGGNMGITADFELTATTDQTLCKEHLVTDSSLNRCAILSAKTEPSFSFNASIRGGVRLGPISAGIVARVRILSTTLPLTASLAWAQNQAGQSLISSKALWVTSTRWLEVRIDAFARLRFFFFRVTITVNVYRYQTRPLRMTLLNRSLETVALE
ncbi:hypothetical protein [Pseudobacteriovorax antillogorgiicola]|uniref:Uncharacterized protein n=1 Tax=Pseudobacteriovorax antillogorgiicola TaxID=1513793 RepID=A0A1Y6BAB5_9BACT|nr:hypothetical protein [Pseudobacteriovorax antillogorgiicola]TCS57558.1 hypothetical protein EDD56_103298 [Pseudobacteriovorax antillogorgiicola]SME99781.1 hypothetical protein SAMN06296036_10335 [Pseudobacteriovorax antillogorgiicola]